MSSQKVYSTRRKSIDFYSQPVNSSLKKMKKNTTSKDELLTFNLQKASTSTENRPTTTIVKLNEDEEKISKEKLDSKSESTSSQAKHGNVYGVILPLVLDANLKPFKQPILTVFDSNVLKEFGFSLPFKDYLSERKNYFEIKFKGTCLTVQIIAIGDTPSDVKKSLKNNMKDNPLWRGLNKMIGTDYLLTDIVHKPLVSSEDIPSQKVLGPSTLKQLFGFCPRQNISNETKDQSQEVSSQVSNGIENSSQEKPPSQHLTTESHPIAGKDSKKSELSETLIEDGESSEYDKSCRERKIKTLVSGRKKKTTAVDSTYHNEKLEEIKETVKELNRKKSSLSEKDTTGSLVLTLIEAIEQISEALKEKHQMFIESAHSVPEEDDTYKIEAKNQIFVEGIVQFDLNSYEFASRKAIPGKPASFGYQLVRYCFPKAYYEGVSLGKKFIERSTIEEILKARKEGGKEPLPLQYVWGFDDPYSKPFEGDFNETLGKQRVKAFINHIFRKCEMPRYSDLLEKSVRERIIKELSSLNARKRTKKQINDDLTESSSNEYDSKEKNGKSSKSKGKRQLQDEVSSKSDEETDSSFNGTWNKKIFN